MILVMLGTQNNSFHRLLEEVEKLIKNNVINEEVIVQAGYTKYESSNMEVFSLIAQEELEKYQEKANFIITHGGVGSIIGALKKGKKVIAIPRLHKYGEHVNDHQMQIVETFEKEGYIIGINDVSELEKAIEKIGKFKPKEYISNNNKMISIIENFIDNLE